MLRSALFTLLFLLIVGTGMRCQPKKVDPTPIGMLVIDTICDHIVVELVQGEVDGSKVEPEWKDPNTNTVYINAFTVSDRCSFARNGLSVGDRFSFEFDTAPPADTCVICQIAYPTPSVTNAVKNVRRIN